MIIDSNVLFGHWAFRSLPITTIDQLIERMDSFSIDKALISSINAILYKNCRQGNEELRAQIQGFGDRLIPAAVINPLYAGWKDDFHSAITEWQVKAVRIYPDYHDYDVSDEKFTHFAEKCMENKLPVLFTVSIEDHRQRHFLDLKENLSPAVIRKTAQKFPGLKIAVMNARYDFIQETMYGIPEKQWENIFFDTCFIFGPPYNHLQKLITSFGTDRFLFGNFMTFRIPGASFKKIEMLEIEEDEKGKIFFKNIKKLLNLNDS